MRGRHARSCVAPGFTGDDGGGCGASRWFQGVAKIAVNELSGSGTDLDSGDGTHASTRRGGGWVLLWAADHAEEKEERRVAREGVALRWLANGRAAKGTRQDMVVGLRWGTGAGQERVG